MKTWTEKGLGRKKCPATGCDLFIAVRSRACVCGHSFESKSSTTKSASKGDKVEARYKTQKPRLIVPSGKCPVEITSTDLETVLDWAEAVRLACPTVKLTNFALRQYARQFFVIGSDDYKIIAGHLA